MSATRQACLFCFVDGDLPKLTREHLLSRPVAVAFGVDRAGGFLRASPNGEQSRVGTLDGVAWRVVCGKCNNGWMNRLEHEMAAVAQWAGSDDQELGEDRELALRAWTIKTHLLLCYIEGNARRFGEPGSHAVLPNYSVARQLYQWETEAIRSAAIGVARVAEPRGFAFAFGNPRVVPIGPKYASVGSATASIISLGSLQVWYAMSLRHSIEVRVPGNVTPVTRALRFGQLRTTPVVGDLRSVVVDNGEHDVAAEMRALHQAVAALEK